jgi:hypothetical protein
MHAVIMPSECAVDFQATGAVQGHSREEERLSKLIQKSYPNGQFPSDEIKAAVDKTLPPQ